MEGFPSPSLTDHSSVVHMRGIKVKFGNVVALDNVEFGIGSNEVVGLLGDNGAGKTTLMMSLIGNVKLDAGQITVGGKDVRFRSPRDAQQAGIETNYQELALVDNMDIRENFFLGREIYRAVGPARFIAKKEMKEALAAFMDSVGFQIGHSVRDRVGSLSGGERRALAILRAFYFKSKLLILDEPTAAMDEDATEQVLRLVEHARKMGVSVIFITHNAHEVFEVADRFVILQKGKNYAELEKEDTDYRGLEKLMIASRLSAMKDIAAGISHQIRNPLGVMKVTAELLRDEFQPKKDGKDYKHILQVLIDEIDTLNLVVNNFLDFARVPKMVKESSSIEDIIRSSIESIPVHQFSKKKIELNIQKSMQDLFLDRSMISQVLTNLIVNALEASKDGGVVEVRAFMESGRLHLEIHDDGTGIPRELQRQVFLPFFTTKKNGTGLGLSIAHRIIEEHGGAIDILSEANQGATFRIVL